MRQANSVRRGLTRQLYHSISCIVRLFFHCIFTLESSRDNKFKTRLYPNWVYIWEASIFYAIYIRDRKKHVDIRDMRLGLSTSVPWFEPASGTDIPPIEGMARRSPSAIALMWWYGGGLHCTTMAAIDWTPRGAGSDLFLLFLFVPTLLTRSSWLGLIAFCWLTLVKH